MDSLEIGDKVNWNMKARGGYGYVIPVAGVVTETGNKRVQIRIAMRADGQWEHTTRWVAPASLSRREKHVPEVDDEPIRALKP